jgi:hypothetical protein
VARHGRSESASRRRTHELAALVSAAADLPPPPLLPSPSPPSPTHDGSKAATAQIVALKALLSASDARERRLQSLVAVAGDENDALIRSGAATHRRGTQLLQAAVYACEAAAQRRDQQQTRLQAAITTLSDAYTHFVVASKNGVGGGGGGVVVQLRHALAALSNNDDHGGDGDGGDGDGGGGGGGFDSAARMLRAFDRYAAGDIARTRRLLNVVAHAAAAATRVGVHARAFVTADSMMPQPQPRFAADDADVAAAARLQLRATECASALATLLTRSLAAPRADTVERGHLTAAPLTVRVQCQHLLGDERGGDDGDGVGELGADIVVAMYLDGVYAARSERR